MEKKICLMLCLAAVLLAASVASADTVKWKLKDGSASGDWGVGSNWSTGNVPTDLDLVLTGKYANEVEIHVTDAQSMGNKARFGDDALLTAPLLRIKSGGTLSQATSGMAKSYLGYVSDADVIVEAGGTWNITHRLYIGDGAGVTGKLDIAGTVNSTGNFYVGNDGVGLCNVLDGGVLNLKGFGTTTITSSSTLDILGEGMVISAGSQVNNANTLIAGGRIAGDGVLGDVYAYFDGTNTIIAVVPEPATMILLGLGGLLLRKRRR